MHAGSKRSNNTSNVGPPSKKRKIDKDDHEEDEFEKYMKQINQTARKQKKKAIKKQKQIQAQSPNKYIANTNNKKQAQRVDFEQETPMDAFIEQMKDKNTMFLPSRKGTDGYNSDDEVYNVAKYVNKLKRDEKDQRNKFLLQKEANLKYDDYGNVITADKDRIIEDLPPIDHSKIWYKKFNRNFYKQHQDLNNLNNEQIKAIRDKHKIHVAFGHHDKKSIDSLPAPIESFPYFGFDEKLMDIIIDKEYSAPTPIQMQSLPMLMSGHDMIGLAKTGSGKTAAFIIPMIQHILKQIEDDPVEKGYDGPIGLILSPTHELAVQIYRECLSFVQRFGLRVAPLYGGMQMHAQRLLLREGVEIVIANPGRLIDLIKDKSTNCRRLTYVVIDEVDKMFSLGFESQIRSIIGQIRTDRQICMFSATMNEKIEQIASDTLSDDYIRVRIGDTHLSNTNINQYIDVVQSNDYKFKWLCDRIQVFLKKGLIIIFCSSKNKCEILARKLNNFNIPTTSIHGDKLQKDRQDIITNFEKEKFKILVATDVASRGINIVNIKTVINYDCPFNLDAYIHRVGRTGRGNDCDGTAFTLLTPNEKIDKRMAPKLLNLLKKLRMQISPLLEQMVRGDFDQKNEKNDYIGSHIKCHEKDKNKAISAAKSSFYKNGFDSKNTKAVKKSFKNSFVKSSDNNNNNNKANNIDYNKFVKSDGQTHVFDADTPLPKKTKRSRWGN